MGKLLLENSYLQKIFAVAFLKAYILNQARAGRRRAPGFLKLILCGSSVCMFVCVCVCACVCVRARGY